MTSYITDKGCLVFHYDPVLDNYEDVEQAALIKHNLLNARVTTIAVTRRTDFLRLKNETINGTRQTGKPDTKGLTDNERHK